MSLEEAAARRQDMRDRAAERRMNVSLGEATARRQVERDSSCKEIE